MWNPYARIIKVREHQKITTSAVGQIFGWAANSFCNSMYDRTRKKKNISLSLPKIVHTIWEQLKEVDFCFQDNMSNMRVLFEVPTLIATSKMTILKNILYEQIADFFIR
jgi:hypothetical protein